MQDQVNILIGIGGTGAKVIEAALVLLAAGVGPEGTPVHVGLIDQDEANGNVARTRDLLGALVKFRREWGRMDGAHMIDWKSRGADRVWAGSVDVRPLFEDEGDALYCPEKEQATLRTIIGSNLDADREALFNLLFMPGREEQLLPLFKGYRGRAHVGATALVAAMLEDDNKLMRRLGTLLDDPGYKQVNVFIVGSAYGGTGAAGFPTLARALHRLRSAPTFRNRSNGRANVRLGGMLLLPYFSFSDDEDDGEAVVTSGELMPKAQLALQYYDDLFEGERAFDHFYALGWDRLFNLGYHQSGAKEQSNPALPAELFGATAAIDFLRRVAAPDTIGDTEAESTRIMVSARNASGVRWADLPFHDEIEARLGQLLRTAIYWRLVALDEIDAPRGFLGRANWVQRLAKGASRTDAVAELAALDGLIERVLTWAATVEKCAGTQWSQGPWNLHHFVTEQDSPTAPVVQRRSMALDQVLDGFDALVRIDSGDFVPRSSVHLHADLHGGRVSVINESRGLGLVFATVAKAASLKGV